MEGDRTSQARDGSRRPSQSQSQDPSQGQPPGQSQGISQGPSQRPSQIQAPSQGVPQGPSRGLSQRPSQGSRRSGVDNVERGRGEDLRDALSMDQGVAGAYVQEIIDTIIEGSRCSLTYTIIYIYNIYNIHNVYNNRIYTVIES